MCGRFQLKLDEDWMAAFGVPEPPDLTPRYNIAPTQGVVAIRRNEEGVREADLLKWGLVPSFAEDPAVGNRMINARSETVARLPAFREPFQKRRCLVPANGFYEWRRAGRLRDPFLLKMKDGEPPDLIEGVFQAVGHPWTLTFEGGRYEESQFGPDYGRRGGVLREALHAAPLPSPRAANVRRTLPQL